MDQSVVVSAQSKIPVPKIHDTVDVPMDYGDTLNYTVLQNGYYYSGTLKKVGMVSGWLFRYEGYLYNTRMVPTSITFTE